ncbi:MAG: phosphoribosylformylglycinamidine synthase subunit PurL [Chloroflexota bacterium]|jgi:phosphoribosylformylglycinamidine synthase|nr:phosphoribosylformylglycinamidine synthase subunit PurL [Chloroflexota bacterium]
MSVTPMISGTTTAQPKYRLPREAGLTESEAERVRALLGREPNALEWGMFGAMWSEHCAYKHSKALLRTLPTTGARVALGPGENAGAVDLGENLLCVFKVESHNHPSAVEPYQGAATGVGGILRDIFAMGARPIAVLNGLFFGPPELERTRRMIRGVVGGISFYGNCVGIPDVGGHVSFAPGYADNPLVNAMCVGLVERKDLRSAATARPGSAVYLVGSDTGRDGIAGASLLASFELGSADETKRPSVQVGNPFLEKLLLEATLELVAQDAVEAIQDLGAAGLTCASSELAAKSNAGMRIDVDRVPRRATGMVPYEVMLSESQERMLVIARPGREADIERVFARWELHGVRIGEVTADERLEIRSGGDLVASLPPKALADDAPEYDVRAWAKEPVRGAPAAAPVAVEHSQAEGPQKIGLELLQLLGSPDVASRAVLYRTYDQMVGTDTVVGPGADAAVMRIKGRPDGIAVALDAQPRVASLDPFIGAAAAVAEATRNLVCVGAEPLAITDCLNLGNPERPEGAWQLERTVAGIAAACDALGVPVVSGNVSLYNATRGSDIWPTATIGAVGRIAEVGKHIPARAGAAGDLVLLAGSAQVSLAGSTYAAMHGQVEGTVRIDLALEARLQRFVLAAHARGAIRAAHDRAEGGLGVALAELAIRDRIGMRVTLPAVRGIDKRVMLFGEGPSGIVLVIRTADELLVRAIATEHDVPLWTLGAIGGDILEIAPVLGTPVEALARAHGDGLARALGRAS